jgi:2-C-methyl-D-erythritol 2,4-cyclodiphosphate synthase
MTRIGFGYDVHKLVLGRNLILGGITVPSTKGLLGHSDADVLLHAICDALLGAAALGDIGNHFPDSDERFRGISSVELLKSVKILLNRAGYTVGNIDSTVVLEEPKIAPYIDPMRESIAQILEVPILNISVKATTNEKLGFIGSGEGAVAYAVAIIYPM